MKKYLNKWDYIIAGSHSACRLRRHPELFGGLAGWTSGGRQDLGLRHVGGQLHLQRLNPRTAARGGGGRAPRGGSPSSPQESDLKQKNFIHL